MFKEITVRPRVTEKELNLFPLSGEMGRTFLE
jgi:hypothetical protein